MTPASTPISPGQGWYSPQQYVRGWIWTHQQNLQNRQAERPSGSSGPIPPELRTSEEQTATESPPP